MIKIKYALATLIFIFIFGIFAGALIFNNISITGQATTYYTWQEKEKTSGRGILIAPGQQGATQKYTGQFAGWTCCQIYKGLTTTGTKNYEWKVMPLNKCYQVGTTLDLYARQCRKQYCCDQDKDGIAEWVDRCSSSKRVYETDKCTQTEINKYIESTTP